MLAVTEILSFPAPEGGSTGWEQRTWQAPRRHAVGRLALRLWPERSTRDVRASIFTSRRSAEFLCLTVEEETALARRAFKGDVEAQERLARHNVRFVVSVAKKFQNRGVPLMDLIGEGNVGLMTAARKFDPDRGVKFISYAVWWIRQAIQAAIARHGRPVRLPLNRTADLTRLGRVTTLLTEKLGPGAHNRGAGLGHWADA